MTNRRQRVTVPLSFGEGRGGIVRDEQVKKGRNRRGWRGMERKFQALEGRGAFLRCLVPFVLQPFVTVTRQSHPSALSTPSPLATRIRSPVTSMSSIKVIRRLDARCYCDEISSFPCRRNFSSSYIHVFKRWRKKEREGGREEEN